LPRRPLSSSESTFLEHPLFVARDDFRRFSSSRRRRRCCG
jgi:hypothetical protein